MCVIIVFVKAVPLKLFRKVFLNMAYKITDECIMCGACVDECPVEAIAEGDGKYEIDADKCIDCGSCNGVCPVGAPVAE